MNDINKTKPYAVLDYIPITGPGVTMCDITHAISKDYPSVQYALIGAEILTLVQKGLVKRHGSYYWRVDK